MGQTKEQKEIEKVGGFAPTENMQKLLSRALRPECGFTPVDWCLEAGITQQQWGIWKNNPEFIEWFTREFEMSLQLQRLEWLKIGLRKMGQDFKHWKEMGDKIFYPNGLKYTERGIGSSRSRLEQELIAIKRKYVPEVADGPT